MRQHTPARIRFESNTRYEAASCSPDPVRTRELLLKHPDGGFALAHKHALLLPGAQRPRRLVGVVRTDEPDSVVGARGEQPLSHLGRDDVVWRRDEIVQPSGPLRVVTEGAKRLDEAHGEPGYHPRFGLHSAR